VWLSVLLWWKSLGISSRADYLYRMTHERVVMRKHCLHLRGHLRTIHELTKSPKLSICHMAHAVLHEALLMHCMCGYPFYGLSQRIIWRMTLAQGDINDSDLYTDCSTWACRKGLL
jgi:hypothetical protein